MYKCELSDIYAIEGEDKFSEETDKGFGQSPDIRWAVQFTFLVSVINQEPRWWQKSKQLIGDEIYGIVCSPAYAANPNLKFYDSSKGIIVLDRFSEDELRAAINKRLSKLKGESIEELFAQIETKFDTEEAPSTKG